MSSKVVVSMFFLVCIGLCSHSTEGSFAHPYNRFQHSFWPDFDFFDEHFPGPFFHDSFDWDPFKDDKFFIDFEFPPLRGPARFGNCQSKSASRKVQAKPANEGLKINVNVEGFTPRELTLVTKGNEVVLKGEKLVCDFTSCYKQTYCWKRKLPEDIKMNAIKARLTADNVVEITAQTKREIKGELKTKEEVERELNCYGDKPEKSEDFESVKEKSLEHARSSSPKTSQNMKGDIPTTPTTEVQTNDDEGETTLEVVNDDQQFDT